MVQIVFSHDAVEISDLKNGQVFKVNGQRLKPFLATDFESDVNKVERWRRHWNRKQVTETRLFWASRGKVEEPGAEISVIAAPTLSYSRFRVCFSV